MPAGTFNLVVVVVGTVVVIAVVVIVIVIIIVDNCRVCLGTLYNDTRCQQREGYIFRLSQWKRAREASVLIQNN